MSPTKCILASCHGSGLHKSVSLPSYDPGLVGQIDTEVHIIQGHCLLAPPQDHASMLPSSIPPSFFQLSKIHQSLGAYSAHSHLEKYLISFNSFVTSVTSGSLGRQKLNYYDFMRKQKIFLLHKTLFVVAQNIVILSNKLYGRYPKMFP